MNSICIRRAWFLSFVLCFIFTGCTATNAGSIANDGRPELTSIYDYSDWYYDIDNSANYNFAAFIELDVWYKTRVSGYDWTDVTFDVWYENKVIASDLAVIVDLNYMKCYFDTSFESAVLTDEGYLAPGLYKIVLNDAEGNSIVSSSCNVSVDSGNTLSQMVTNKELIANQADQIALRIHFDDSVLAYSKGGLYITVSLDEGKTSFVPEKYSIEIADTFITIRYLDPDVGAQTIILSLYSRDNSLVCSEKIDL